MTTKTLSDIEDHIDGKYISGCPINRDVVDTPLLRKVAKEHFDILKKELKELLKRTKKVSFDEYEKKIQLGILAARIVAKMEWINEFFDLKENLENLEDINEM